MHRRSIRMWSLLLAAGTLASAAAAATPRSYSLQVELDPAKGRLEVDGEVTVVRADRSASALEFLLHESLEIKRLKVNGNKAAFRYREEPPTALRPASRRVVVNLPTAVVESELRIELRYRGQLRSLPQFGTEKATEIGRALDDAINSDRVELSYSSSWFPQFGDFGALFEADVEIVLPEGWTEVCTGELLQRQAAGRGSRSRWVGRRTADLVVIASPRLRMVRISSPGGAVEFYYTRLPKEFIDREADTIRRILELYTDLLGAPDQPGATVRTVYSPRDAGQGGYSRPPMVVMSEGRVLAALAEDPSLSMMRGIAHEAAHFWWSFGSGQADWINESFAEYFSLVAVEELQSRAAYDQAVASHSAAVNRLPADAPSLAEVPASNEAHGYTIRYHKGSLMLDAFREAMGDAEFFVACHLFFEARQGKATSTEDFIEFWISRLPEDSVLVQSWLNARGGVPAASE